MSSPILETQRLKLREFSQDDLDVLAAMVADEEQMTFYPRPKTRDEASAWIGRNLVLYKEYGFGFWFIECLSSSAFLGYCGIRPLALEGASEIEIGWHTKKTSWSRGIATEAATAARDLAFGRFAIPRLMAIIHPDHIASRRIAEKIGMHDERTTVLDGYPAVIYVTERPPSSRARPVRDRRSGDSRNPCSPTEYRVAALADTGAHCGRGHCRFYGGSRVRLPPTV